MEHTKKRGLLLICVGACAVLAAVSLLLFNQWEQQQAATASRIAMQKMEQTLNSAQEKVQMAGTGENGEMPVIEIDGELYIGVLRIPSLELELPVMSQWSYSKLKMVPCRYSGTTNQKNLVLLGHNYKRHFGRLHTLKNGDQIQFEDVNQNVQNYSVQSIQSIDPENVETVISGDCALTLFTCTYSGQQRTMVKCDAVNPV